MSLEVPPTDFAISETPEFHARGLVALAGDDHRHRFNTLMLSSFDLAGEYGIDDLGDSRPDSWSLITAKEANPVANPLHFR